MLLAFLFGTFVPIHDDIMEFHRNLSSINAIVPMTLIQISEVDKGLQSITIIDFFIISDISNVCT